MKRWHENDELARRLISEGHEWEAIVAEELASRGLNVEIQSQHVRDDVSSAFQNEYAFSFDLIVDGFTTQVKSRNVSKWHDPLYVCNLRSWHHVGSTTDIWICIARQSKDMVCTSGDVVRNNGYVVSTYDSVRNIQSMDVMCLDLHHWTPIDDLVDWLISRRKS